VRLLFRVSQHDAAHIHTLSWRERTSGNSLVFAMHVTAHLAVYTEEGSEQGRGDGGGKGKGRMEGEGTEGEGRREGGEMAGGGKGKGEGRKED